MIMQQPFLLFFFWGGGGKSGKASATRPLASMICGNIVATGPLH